MRFAAPELREASRAAARHEGAVAVSQKGMRRSPPFLLTMGAPSIGLAVKSLAFVAKDLTKEHLAGVPPLLVVPKFWERKVMLSESQEGHNKHAA